MGVRAKCSRCDYLRTFADELRGTFYRCPKCRQGVIAVPTDAKWEDESEEAPRVRAARTLDNRSSEEAARALESSGDRLALDAPASGGRDGGVGVDETPKGILTAVLADREDASTRAPGGKSRESSTASSSTSSTPELARSDARAPAKGQTFTVQRILVECVGCGHHVAVPPAFFGKTVRCPECKADMAFSESSLEPVKDEILGRIALEQAERKVLSHAVPPPIESPETRRRARRRQIAIVGSLVAVLAGAVVFFLFKIFH